MVVAAANSDLYDIIIYVPFIPFQFAAKSAQQLLFVDIYTNSTVVVVVSVCEQVVSSFKSKGAVFFVAVESRQAAAHLFFILYIGFLVYQTDKN